MVVETHLVGHYESRLERELSYSWVINPERLGNVPIVPDFEGCIVVSLTAGDDVGFVHAPTTTRKFGSLVFHQKRENGLDLASFNNVHRGSRSGMIPMDGLVR